MRGSKADTLEWKKYGPAQCFEKSGLFQDAIHKGSFSVWTKWFQWQQFGPWSAGTQSLPQRPQPWVSRLWMLSCSQRTEHFSLRLSTLYGGKFLDIQPTRSAPGSQVLAAQEIRSRGTSAFALSILQSFFLYQVMLTCCTSSAFCSPGHLRRHWNTSTCRSEQKSNTRNCESSEIKVWDCHEMYCTPVCFGLLFAVDHANTHLACPRQSGNTTTSSTEGKASQSESESSLSLSERV